jgi:hypothetical protein
MPLVPGYLDDAQRGKQQKGILPEPPTQHNILTKSVNLLSRHHYSFLVGNDNASSIPAFFS